MLFWSKVRSTWPRLFVWAIRTRSFVPCRNPKSKMVFALIDPMCLFTQSATGLPKFSSTIRFRWLANRFDEVLGIGYNVFDLLSIDLAAVITNDVANTAMYKKPA